MKLAVCGMGRVGRPILDCLRYVGFEAVGYDIDRGRSEVLLPAAVKQSDACIFIVQTPSAADGSFSNEYLKAALLAFSGEARVQCKRDYVFIIGSTVTPGSCEAFREFVGDYIVYKPEFIRLAHVRQDLMNPAFVLIGADNPFAGDRAAEIYTRISSAPIRRMGLLEAELAKITLNCALTMKISLANQLWLVAKKLGADAETIMQAVGSDPRIGPAYLKPGEPFGGPCLPRDNRMFAFVAQTVGVDACLSRAVDEINTIVRNTWK